MTLKQVLLFFLLTCSNFLYSQSVPPDYQIGTWRGFSKSAVTYTWDDNTPSQLSVAKPLFDQYQYKVTFFVVTNWGVNWTGFSQAALEGHEIGSHSRTHSDMGGQSDSLKKDELSVSQQLIHTNIPNATCVSFAYPYCAFINDATTAQYYICARTCQGQIEKSTPANFMQISSITCGANGVIKSSGDFNNKVNSAVASNGWVVFLLHGIDNDGGWSPVQSAELASHLNYMNVHRDSFWVAPFGTVVRYIRERNQSSIQEISNNSTQISFLLTHPLQDSIYHDPLSIRRKVPKGWTSITVIQNNDTLKSKLITVGNDAYIQFDAWPNKGVISIQTTSTNTAVKPAELLPSSLLSVSQDADGAVIFTLLCEITDGQIEMLDVNGQTVFSESLHKNPEGMRRSVHKVFPEGIYLIRLRKENTVYVSRIFIH